MTQAERLHALLEPVVAGTGLVLEAVNVVPAGGRRLVRVVVDLPEDAEGDLDLDRVAAVSRLVSAALDAADASSSPVLGRQPFVLEVGSPGAQRRLTERRHWARARGRLVTAGVASDDDEEELTARVVDVGDDGVLLDGGTAGAAGAPRWVPWSALRRAVVQVELGRRPGDDRGLEAHGRHSRGRQGRKES